LSDEDAVLADAWGLVETGVATWVGEPPPARETPRASEKPPEATDPVGDTVRLLQETYPRKRVFTLDEFRKAVRELG
jgi:hypothetical protein